MIKPGAAAPGFFMPSPFRPSRKNDRSSAPLALWSGNFRQVGDYVYL